MGKREDNLLAARRLLSKHLGQEVSSSRVYQTEAWGEEDQDPFLNQAVIFESSWTPGRGMAKILKLEAQLGRVRLKKMEPRIIDIDMIFYNKRTIDQKKLTIPHPRMHLRNFALIPLCELIPDFVHPVLKKPLKILLDECQDRQKVHVFES